MRKLAAPALFALAVGYTLTHFLVALYNHWYFADHFWLKTLLITPLIAVAFGMALLSPWSKLWRIIGAWWIITHLMAMVPAGGYDLRGLEFVAVLDMEVVVLFIPGLALTIYGCALALRTTRVRNTEQQARARELRLRRQLRCNAPQTSTAPAPVSVPEGD